jgi:hypothetical protein
MNTREIVLEMVGPVSKFQSESMDPELRRRSHVGVN